MTDQAGNSEARDSYGLTFKLANGATPAVLTEIDECTDVALSEEAADTYEVTHFKSPGKRKEFRSGWTDPGTGSITVNYIPGSPTDILLREAQRSGQPRAFQCDLPDEAGEPEWRVSGFAIVLSRGRSTKINDRMTMTVNLRYTGDSTEAAVPAQP